MSIPSIETDNESSTIIEDSMSTMAQDLSDTTVATQTSTSWHSVLSEIHANNNLFIRSHVINTWLKVCFIEPDIRLTTAQEWKLRTCIRRFLSLCDLPLKISCLRTKQFLLNSNDNKTTSFINQTQQVSSMFYSSLNTLDDDSGLEQSHIVDDQLPQLRLHLHVLSTVNELLEAKLFEYNSKTLQNRSTIYIPLIKPPRFVFHLLSNILKLSLRTSNSLLQLQFSTRENEPVRGYYYKWNVVNNEYITFDITVDVDHSLINELTTA